MFTITEKDIRAAADEMKAFGLSNFLYQEPGCQRSSRRSSSSSSLKKKNEFKSSFKF